MHDLDRTLNEYETDPEGFGVNQFEFLDETWNETDQEVVDEATELQLAAELLEVADEQELDQFLGKMFRGIGRGVSRLARGPLGGMLKGVARKALPIVGGVAGTFLGGPAGAALGSRLAGGASQLFGLEVEGLSGEDQEFEVARRFVRLASAAIRNAANAATGGDPRGAARAALIAAARRHAPGLLVQVGGGGCPPGCGCGATNGSADGTNEMGYETTGPISGGTSGGTSGGATGGGRRSGRWVRRGNRIIIIGV